MNHDHYQRVVNEVVRARDCRQFSTRHEFPTDYGNPPGVSLLILATGGHGRVYEDAATHPLLHLSVNPVSAPWLGIVTPPWKEVGRHVAL